MAMVVFSIALCTEGGHVAVGPSLLTVPPLQAVVLVPIAGTTCMASLSHVPTGGGVSLVEAAPRQTNEHG